MKGSNRGQLIFLLVVSVASTLVSAGVAVAGKSLGASLMALNSLILSALFVVMLRDRSKG